MSVSYGTYARLSNNVYAVSQTGVSNNAPALPTGWKLADYKVENGQVSALYVNETTHDAVVAYQGTAGGKDIIPDVGIATNGLLAGAALQQRNDLASAHFDIFSSGKYSGYSFSVTGHSLGGEEAKYVASVKEGLGGVVINAPDVPTMQKGNYFYSSNIVEIGDNGDIVAHTGGDDINRILINNGTFDLLGMHSINNTDLAIQANPALANQIYGQENLDLITNSGSVSNFRWQGQDIKTANDDYGKAFTVNEQVFEDGSGQVTVEYYHNVTGTNGAPTQEIYETRVISYSETAYGKAISDVRYNADWSVIKEVNYSSNSNTNSLTVGYTSPASGNIGTTTGQTGMMNTYDLTTGVEIGSASTYDGTVYPNYSGTFGTDLSTTVGSITSTLNQDSSYAASLTDFRDFADVVNTGGLWGGSLLLEGANLSDTPSDTYGFSGDYGSPTFSANNYSNFDFSKILANKLDAPGKFFWSGNSDSGSISITYVPAASYTTTTVTTTTVTGSTEVSSYSYVAMDSYSLSFQLSNNGYEFNNQFSWAFPIALDLDGDGVELINRDDSHAYFDMTGSGYRNHTGWVSADDGLLVLDINRDNQINQAKELSFALWTDNPDDTDMEGLKATFDNNHDGVIDKDDDVFAGLRVWQDKNGNGISEDGELKTLTEAGITSINLNSVKTNWSSGGNSIQGFSTYDKTSLDSHGYTVTTHGFVGDVALGYEVSNWQTNTKDGLVQVSQSGGLTYALGGADALNLNLATGNLSGVFGNTGNDNLNAKLNTKAVVLEGGAGNDILQGGTGDDWLNGGDGVDQLNGGAGDDTLVIDSFDNLSKVSGGAGFDTVIVTGDIGITLNLTKTKIEVAIGSDGDDTFSLSNVSLHKTVSLFGGKGNDHLTGGAERDIIEGGTDNDTLTGNLGNDVYMFSRGDGADTILERSKITIVGKDNDTIIMGQGLTVADVLIVKSGNDILIGLKPDGEDVPATVDSMDKLAAYINTLQDHITITNGTLDKYKVEHIGFASGGLYSIDRWVQGTSASDSDGTALRGGDKADVITGGASGDAMFGGLGGDVYVVDNVNDVVIELAKAGHDTVVSSITYTLTDNVENLQLVGKTAIDGTGNLLDNTLTGNTANNTLNGAEGNDTLDGGAGNDSLVGGLGDDTYIVDSNLDVILEDASAGKELVQSYASTYTLSDNIENITLMGTGGEAIGNAMDNLMKGTAGNDTLNGGAGSDILIGGDGNDTYVVDTSADIITEKAGKGTDTVKASFNETLGTNLENLVLVETIGLNGSIATKGTGNALNNVITGNGQDNLLKGLAGNDWLNGGVGKDTMIGGTEDDTYVVDNASDVVTELAAQGTDTVISHLTFYTLADNVENLTLGGTGMINGTGNIRNNTLLGNSADNILDGAAGNDQLDGGIGKDTMTGGTGNDTYYVGSIGDVVVETEADSKIGGIDKVLSDIDYILGSHVENLSLTNTVGINGLLAQTATGNALNNIINGNYADNTIDGGIGADTMTGSLGDDTYYVDNAGDVVTELNAQGIDTIISSVSIGVLASYVENLTLTGTAISGSGNALDNTIIGNDQGNKLYGGSGNDTLDGRLGADVMIGGLGNDTYYVDVLGDVVTESAGQGTDTVYSNLNYILSTDLENLILTEVGNANGELAVTLDGNTLNNLLVGNSVANVLAGNAGNDTLNGGLGADIMRGGLGSDTYVVDNANDNVMEDQNLNAGIDIVQSAIDYQLGKFVENLTLTGTAIINGTGNELANYLTGNVMGNELYGNVGNDTLDGGVGADTLIGGSGNDTYYVDSSSDVVKETDSNGLDTGGIDTVLSTSASYVLSANLENLTLTGSGMISGTGNDIANLIRGNIASNTLDGGLGADTLRGGFGDDIYKIDSLGDIVVEDVDHGIDTVITGIDNYVLAENVENLSLTGNAINATGNTLNNQLTGNALNNQMRGGDGSDTLNGAEGNDTLFGGAGNDLLEGGIGADSLAGGLGDDIYLVDSIDDVVTENADITDANGLVTNFGKDTIQTSVTRSLTDNFENLTLTGYAAIDGTGNIMANVITGNSNNNVLSGDAGADTLFGGGGLDTLLGGKYSDLFIVNDEQVTVIEYFNEGVSDTVQSAITYTLTDNVENLILNGTDDYDGTGNGLENTLTGNDGDNQLDGGAGLDTMSGGLGDDTYIVDSSLDKITENANAGIDAVESSATYTLSANLENLTLVGSATINGMGNALDNMIIGNDAANTLNGSNPIQAGSDGNDALKGGAGNDSLVGGNGNDLLDGGADTDTMKGSSGDDVYVVDNINDVVFENANIYDANGVLTTNYGNDTIQSSISWTLGDNIENLTLLDTTDIYATNDIDGKGNDLNNILTGNSGANTLTGLKGNDTYVVDNVDDVVVENAAEGNDTVQSSINYTLGNNIENLVLTSTLAITGIGNSANNTITGSSADNSLVGGAGNDSLDGGEGIDNLAGGADNDTYWVDDINDAVIEDLNAGLDKVFSTADSYTLADNVEYLTLLETADISGTGNALSNVINGNVGSNILDGDLGADIMRGGLGDDTYYVDNAGDSVVELASQGTDKVDSSIDYILGDNLENLTLIGTAINGTGNLLDNVITGNGESNLLLAGAGNDTLDGGMGADTMRGSLGNDVFVIDDTGDVVIENADIIDIYGVVTNYGNDTIQSSISWSLVDNIENLALIGDSAINGIGTKQSNVLIGNTANNSLDGGAGNDTLDGGVGDDILTGGAGDDVYFVDSEVDAVNELDNGGTDTINSTVNYSLIGEYVEKLVLIGNDAINGTGNGYNNKLTGNSNNNTLNGGIGNDTMAGGLGNDTYVVDSSLDVIQENLDEGIDTIYSSVSVTTLSANVENLTLILDSSLAIVATGNLLDNTLIGNEVGNTLKDILGGNDTLDGGAGADIMSGGIGNDTYMVDNLGDSVVENADTATAKYGIDTVMSSINYSLSANLENLTLLTGQAVNGTGNELNNIIIGNGNANNLIGYQGNDTLDGAGGGDTLTGGVGNDTYIVDNAQDSVIENAGEGTDTVQSSITIIKLVSNVENLVLTGAEQIDGTGNELNNIITGNDSNNTLDGDLGKDILIGGKGDDSYIVDVDNDAIIENDSEGTDTVYSLSNYTLSANLENLTLTGTLGTENLNGTGNEKDNVMIGNGGNNTLIGLDGNDTLDGNYGQDTLIGGLGDDAYKIYSMTEIISENANEGMDTVYSQISYILGGNLENLTLTTSQSINGTGNALNNTITGNNGNNILNGAGGSNILVGGLGKDIFQLTAAGSFNTITDFTEGDDAIQINSGVYASLSTSGMLDAASFKSGAGLVAAEDANDFLIYDSSTGILYYDEEGNTTGSAGAVQIASLTSGLNLTYSDFMIG